MNNLKKIIFDNIKDILPNNLNNLLSNINRNQFLIFGKEYKKHFCKLQDIHRQGNPNIEFELLNLVNFAIDNVPYYRKRYKDLQINSIEEFKKRIQPIDKEIVLNNFDEFIADNIELEKYDFCTTSGTTGQPLRLYLPKDRFIIETATLHHYWSKIGYSFSKRAVIRMDKLPRKKKCVINPISKEYKFDGFRLNDQYCFKIYDLLKKYNISFLHGYPSNLFQFGKFLKREELDYSFIKGIFSSSEEVTEHMRFFFDCTLKIPLVDFYGHTEKLIFASNIGSSSDYYVDSHYGYTEVLNEKNEDVFFGELTGTTLHNYGMPLIRYRTGDNAYVKKNSNEEQIRVGSLILSKIQGRANNNRIYYNDNTFVTATAFVLHGEIYSKIDGLQYYQKEKGSLTIRVVKNELYDLTTEKKLREIYKSKFENKVSFEIKYVKELEKNKNGKLLLLLSEVPTDS